MLWIILGNAAADYKSQLENIRRQIRRVSREIKRLRGKEEALIKRVELYERKKELLENYLQTLRVRENFLRVRLNFTQKQLAELRREEAKILRKVRSGINLLFLLGKPPVWAAIFNPKRAYAMYERAAITEATLRAYRNALVQIEGFRKDYSWWKKRREDLLKEINENIKEQESTLAEIKRTEENLKRSIAKLRRSRRAKERYIARLRAKERNLIRLLKKLSKRKSKRGKTSPKRKLTGKLMWPISGKVVRKFGYYKDPIYGVRLKSSGIEIAGRYGQEVVAAAPGKVVYAGRLEGYNRVVILDHGNFFTVYANLMKVSINVGKKVKKGQKIGIIGRRPLHFEVRLGSGKKAVDPLSYLP
ncbi:MAG: peptidoglycan DD-metalloendopeptidase family protein [Thermotogae bacterium]|nr:peptidoglycan DD-metalloendopeptidase family protein [Thermotogota bacterium]